MSLPKKTDCSDCLEYGPVKWMQMQHGMDAVCAPCLVNRMLTLKKAKPQEGAEKGTKG